MKSKEYIFNSLRELVGQFPQITFRYQFDELEQIHIVEVTPLEAYKDEQEYKLAEGDLTYEFDRAFSPETIMFVSEDSLTGITKPEKIFRHEDHFVWEFLQDLISGEEVISKLNFSEPENNNSFDLDEFQQKEFSFSTNFPETDTNNKTSFSQHSNYALAA